MRSDQYEAHWKPACFFFAFYTPVNMVFQSFSLRKSHYTFCSSRVNVNSVSFLFVCFVFTNCVWESAPCPVLLCSFVFFSPPKIGYFLIDPVELIKTNRDLMGKCTLYFDIKWVCGETGRVSWILVHIITKFIALDPKLSKPVLKSHCEAQGSFIMEECWKIDGPWPSRWARNWEWAYNLCRTSLNLPSD